MPQKYKKYKKNLTVKKLLPYTYDNVFITNAILCVKNLLSGGEIMKKTMCLIAVFVLVAAGLFAGGGAAKGGKTQVGFVSCNLNDPFQGYVLDAFKEFFADKPEFELLVQDAREDTVQQKDQVDNLISQGVKALVVVPVDTSAVQPITSAATQAKIPLVYVNRNPFGEGTPPANVYYVGSQEVIAGQLQGEAMGKLLNGQGAVCILMGILSNEGALKRTEGNEGVLKSKYPGIQVLAKEAGNWQRDQGLNITQNWITAYGSRLKGILANNDEMALGAIEALKTANRTDVIVMGVDAIPDGKAAVRNGTMSATVLQDAVGQGRGAAEAAYKALRGEKQDSVKWIPFVYIDKSNIAQYP
jgi:inositol transport system substrate-binding protein